MKSAFARTGESEREQERVRAFVFVFVFERVLMGELSRQKIEQWQKSKLRLKGEQETTLL